MTSHRSITLVEETRMPTTFSHPETETPASTLVYTFLADEQFLNSGSVIRDSAR